MASYGLKYLCEYRSKMRGRLLYRIEIEERDAVALTDATALRMRPYSDVFSLKWGSADDPEYTAVKGSSLTLKILCVDDMEYLSLFSVDPLKFRVTIYEYRTDISGAEQRLMLWRGFLSASSYKETFSRPPYVVTLSATDGFALLDSMPFRDASGAKFSGRVQLSTLLTGCMNALGIDLPVSEWVSIDGAGGTERTLSSLFVDKSRIYEIDEAISWKSVLELAVKPFLGQIFQAGGAIHVRRIGSLVGTFARRRIRRTSSCSGWIAPGSSGCGRTGAISGVPRSWSCAPPIGTSTFRSRTRPNRTRTPPFIPRRVGWTRSTSPTATFSGIVRLSPA